MDKKNKNTKTQDTTRKTTRSWSLKSSVVAENSPMPIKAHPAGRQNIGDKKTTSAPEKPAVSKPKPAVAPEVSKPEATQCERSRKNNSGEVMDFVCLDKQTNDGI
ncbi:hypothetical protein H8356DRAFT_1081201 [Neocallimastix lanati (nom. inval.)]|nr:hypothetical protein H8356DRAFT_1081201 [Neocallimastix sp. JGI-2020a]